MLQDDIFKRLIVYKALMLVLIIIWGGSVQMSNADNPVGNNLTDLGGLLFFIFSVVYFFCLLSTFHIQAIREASFCSSSSTFYCFRFCK